MHESLDAIIAAAQTGTPDPRVPGGQPFADPEQEARAREWDEDVDAMVEALGSHQWYYVPESGTNECSCGGWGLSVAEIKRHIAAAALSAVATLPDRGPWEWGWRTIVRSNGKVLDEVFHGLPEEDVRARVAADVEFFASHNSRLTAVLVRRRAPGPVEVVPAGPWEPVEEQPRGEAHRPEPRRAWARSIFPSRAGEATVALDES